MNHNETEYRVKSQSLNFDVNQLHAVNYLFQILTIEDVIRISPREFGNDINNVAIKSLKEKYESTVSSDYGYLIKVLGVNVEKIGKIIHGDGATYHRAQFDALSFYPQIGEIMEGEVVEITDFGAFVKIGPADALLHISQVMDDYVSVDLKGGAIVGQNTKRQLKVGDKVRAKVIAVSIGKGMSMGKIGITCRQPFLGSLEWIKEDIKKATAPQQQGTK
jgi:DNA-directed RNA polymerase subunit E'